METAKRSYEIFHELPEFTSTSAQVESSSAGINGWAKYSSMMDTPESIRGLLPSADEGSSTDPQTQDATKAKCKPKLLVDTSQTVPREFNVKGMDGTEYNGFGTLNFLGEVKQSISAIGIANWTEIELCVDSGACETVMPLSLLSHISVVSSPQSRALVEYEVANGQSIANLGERRLDAVTINSPETVKRIHFQVADVHKCLLSVTKCADMGYTCVLKKDGGFMEDEETGEKIPIERRGNLYVLRMMVRGAPIDDENGQGFTRPAR